MFKTFARFHSFAVRPTRPDSPSLGAANDNERAARRARPRTRGRTLSCRWVIADGNRPICQWRLEADGPGATRRGGSEARRLSATAT